MAWLTSCEFCGAYRFSMRSARSILATPCSVSATVLCLSSYSKPTPSCSAYRFASPRLERHHVLDVRRPHRERLQDALRPILVALGEIVVRRHEVDALARERVQVHRLHGDEGLALAGLHLGDVALVQDDAAHQLDVEQAHAHRALERLAHGRERLEDEVVEALAVLEPLPEVDRLRGKVGVGELLELRLERPDVRRLLGEPLEAAPFAGAEDLFERTELLDHQRTG